MSVEQRSPSPEHAAPPQAEAEIHAPPTAGFGPLDSSGEAEPRRSRGGAQPDESKVPSQLADVNGPAGTVASERPTIPPLSGPRRGAVPAPNGIKPEVTFEKDKQLEAAHTSLRRKIVRKESDEFDEFHAKVGPRKELIKKDKGEGFHELWEGVFATGPTFNHAGPSCMISRKHGYASTSRRIDMGYVKSEGNRISLVSEAPYNAWGIMPREYVVVPWDGQVFLVEPDELIYFCNSVNSGRLRAQLPISFLLRVEDHHKPRPTGMPKVPEDYKEYLLETPITGKVVTVGDEKEDVAVRGDNWLKKGVSLTLNVGKNDGVRAGMEFYPEQDSGALSGSSFYVISLSANKCELLQTGVKRQENRAKAGLRLTTATPLFDRKLEDGIGEWRLVGWEDSGTRAPVELLKEVPEFRFKGAEITICGKDRMQKVTKERASIKTDPSKSPKQIDLTFLDGPRKDPTLVPTQQVPGFDLRQTVVPHQRLHDPRLLQLLRRTLAPVQSQDRRLRHRLVQLHHTHAQTRLPHYLSRRGQSLKAVEQFQVLATHASHHRRQLTPTPQRTRHRVFRDRIGQAIATIPLPQPIERDRPNDPGVPVHARTPQQHPIEGRRRTAGRVFRHARSSSAGGRGTLRTRVTSAPEPKTGLTRCLAGESAGPVAVAANADDAAGNATRGPAPDVTPGGTPHCKSDGTNARAARRTPHSSPADRTSAPQNPRSKSLGADPRDPPTPRPGRERRPSRGVAADTDDSVRVAARDRTRWPGNAGSPSPDASTPPRDYTLRGNNGLADATV